MSIGLIDRWELRLTRDSILVPKCTIICAVYKMGAVRTQDAAKEEPVIKSTRPLISKFSSHPSKLREILELLRGFQRGRRLIPEVGRIKPTTSSDALRALRHPMRRLSIAEIRLTGSFFDEFLIFPDPWGRWRPMVARFSL